MEKEEKKKEWPEWNYRGYMSEFLSLKCAGDVLNVVSPLGTKAQKEITESMAVIKALREIVLREPMVYSISEMGAGNALTSVLAVHLLPIIDAWAYDKKPRNRRWKSAKRFTYSTIPIEQLLEMKDPCSPTIPTIVIAVHPCKDLAVKVVELYLRRSTAKHLVLMPCCVGNSSGSKLTRLVRERLSKYERWCEYLAQKAGGDVYMDMKCESPCRGVIVAHK